MSLNRARDDMFAEIGLRIIIEQFEQDIAVEDLDAHRGEEEFLFACDVQGAVPIPFQAQ